MALRAINYDPNLAEGQRMIRAITILPPSTNAHRVSENRPPDNRPPDNRPRNTATRTHDCHSRVATGVYTNGYGKIL
eukprot:scaffold1651_cov182-Chaetoceros_neogracile.AAC.2